MMAGMAVGSCTKKMCPPSNISSRGAGDQGGQVLAVGRWSDPVVAAATDQGRAADVTETLGGVVTAARLELQARTVLGRLADASREEGHHVGIGLPPVGVPPGIEQLELATLALVRR